jgi:MoxR-like ATPase
VADRTPSTTTIKEKGETMKKPAVNNEITHPLAHRIPETWFAESYESRYFDGFRDIDVLDNARRMRWNTLMYGPTGPGKTSCVYAYGAEMQLPVIYVACNGAVDPATMFVQPVSSVVSVDDVLRMAAELAERMGDDWSSVSFERQMLYIDTAAKLCGERLDLVETEVVLAMRFGGIIYLDEVNSMPPRIAMVLNGALDLRRTVTLAQKGNEPVPLHPNCQIIASYNPDYRGTKPLGEAFKNRFGLQLPFDYDRTIEEKLVLGIPSLLDLADMLRSAHDDGTIETPVGPNMLLEFEELADTFSVSFAISNFVNRFEPGERQAVRETISTHFIDRITTEYQAWSERDDDEEVQSPAPKSSRKGK